MYFDSSNLELREGSVDSRHLALQSQELDHCSIRLEVENVDRLAGEAGSNPFRMCHREAVQEGIQDVANRWMGG